MVSGCRENNDCMGVGMKRSFLVTLPKQEQRLKSDAWFQYTRNLDRAILNMRIKEKKK